MFQSWQFSAQAGTGGRRGSPDMKRRRVRQGGLDDLSQTMDLPDGFASLEDIFMWPDAAWDAFIEADSGALAFLRTLSERQAFLYSFYSGKGTDGTISTYFNRLFAKKGMTEHGRKARKLYLYHVVTGQSS